MIFKRISRSNISLKFSIIIKIFQLYIFLSNYRKLKSDKLNSLVPFQKLMEFSSPICTLVKIPLTINSTEQGKKKFRVDIFLILKSFSCLVGYESKDSKGFFFHFLSGEPLNKWIKLMTVTKKLLEPYN